MCWYYSKRKLTVLLRAGKILELAKYCVTLQKTYKTSYVNVKNRKFPLNEKIRVQDSVSSASAVVVKAECSHFFYFDHGLREQLRFNKDFHKFLLCH